MEIGEKGTDYSGRIEIWWISAKQYRMVIDSPKFHQVDRVNGEATQEQNEGDYYPRWLENFVLALIDPVPMAGNFSGQANISTLSPHIMLTAISRDDRVNGITDPMTEGRVTLNGPDFLLLSTAMFNNLMAYSDWKQFEGKIIARTYQTKVLDNQPVVGHLTVLDALKHPDESMFAIAEATPADQRISTSFISTTQAESLTEKVPDIQWPSVHEGRTDGYMIVYARTDRTGQVRETSEYSSHNPAVEKFGMEQALKYKFKPLLVNGVAVQFETPLVLHFTSRIEDPIPILTVEEMRHQTISCKPKNLPRGTVPAGTVIHYRISVDEKGKMAGLGPVDGPQAAEWTPTGRTWKDWAPAIGSLRQCKFMPYMVNGHSTYYKGDIELIAR